MAHRRAKRRAERRAPRHAQGGSQGKGESCHRVGAPRRSREEVSQAAQWRHEDALLARSVARAQPQGLPVRRAVRRARRDHPRTSQRRTAALVREREVCWAVHHSQHPGGRVPVDAGHRDERTPRSHHRRLLRPVRLPTRAAPSATRLPSRSCAARSVPISRMRTHEDGIRRDGNGRARQARCRRQARRGLHHRRTHVGPPGQGGRREQDQDRSAASHHLRCVHRHLVSLQRYAVPHRRTADQLASVSTRDHPERLPATLGRSQRVQADPRVHVGHGEGHPDRSRDLDRVWESLWPC